MLLHHLFLAGITINVPGKLPTDPTSIILRLLTIVPLVGGYLLAREGRGNIILELGAAILLVTATLIPVNITASALNVLPTEIAARWVMVAFIMGVALIRDGGLGMIIGIALLAVSGLVIIT